MEEEHEEGGGGEGGGMMRWLITYADLITLLLAFFIVLYAMNRTEQIKFSLVAQALAQNFDSNSIVGSSPGPSIVTGNSGTHAQRAQKQQLQSLSHLQTKLQTAIDKAGLGNEVAVTSNERGVEVSLDATTLFKPGSAELSPAAMALMGSIGRVLATVPNDIEVVGYTDSTPIHTSRYPSNWQLSAMRAANVVYQLSRVPKIGPQRLSLAGFGQYHPVASNSTAAGRAKNRRVNILVLRQDVAQVAIGQGP
ncbi:OmpA family protein [Sulfobacillus sp. DSM 109850]|uniref:OmpA family protein n=2 Tax=Sulfobacillus harzensis TaxID=2729629 RepID=A0A7Y0L569_9FIRM|nr:OmpA family protein [Sulfobacillus harzensis]